MDKQNINRVSQTLCASGDNLSPVEPCTIMTEQTIHPSKYLLEKFINKLAANVNSSFETISIHGEKLFNKSLLTEDDKTNVVDFFNRVQSSNYRPITQLSIRLTAILEDERFPIEVLYKIEEFLDKMYVEPLNNFSNKEFLTECSQVLIECQNILEEENLPKLVNADVLARAFLYLEYAYKRESELLEELQTIQMSFKKTKQYTQ